MPSQYVLSRFVGNSSSGSSILTPTDLSTLLANPKQIPRPAKLLAILREATVYLQDGVWGPDFALLLATSLLPILTDKDNDSRKAARLVYLYITVIVGTSSGGETGAETGNKQLANIYHNVLQDLEASSYFPRTLMVLKALGVLSSHYSETTGVAAGNFQATKLYQLTSDLIRKSQDDLQQLPFSVLRGGGGGGGGGSGGASSKQKKELQEALVLSATLASMLRGVLKSPGHQGFTPPPEWMAFLYTVCFSPNSCEFNEDGARIGLAALLDLGNRCEGVKTEMAVHLFSNKRLRTAEGIQSGIGCVLYLKLCAMVAFSREGISHVIREEFFRILLAAATNDHRLRINLEAVSLLFSLEESMDVELKRIIVPAVGPIATMLTQQISQHKVPLALVHANLRGIHNLATWLVRQQEEEERANAVSVSLTVLTMSSGRGPAALVHEGVLKQLLKAVLITSSLLPETASSSSSAMQGRQQQQQRQQQKNVGGLRNVQLMILQAMIWLAPALPFSLGSNAGGSSSIIIEAKRPSIKRNLLSSSSIVDSLEDVWETLERRLLEAPQFLTDTQLVTILEEMKERCRVQSMSPSSKPTRQKLLQLLLGTAMSFSNSVSSGDLAEGLLKAWEFLLLENAAENAGAVLASIFQVLDKEESGNDLEETAIVAEQRRKRGIWEAHGQSRPSTSCAQRRHARVHLLRLACWFLGEHTAASHFHSEHLGVILLRLQTIALYAEYYTRAAAVGALCKVAVVMESLDVKLSLYEFLLGLEKKTDLTLLATPTQTQGEESASFDLGSGGGLKEDQLAATLQHLRTVLGNVLAPEKAAVASSLLVVTGKGE